ncbi:MAG TPA: hypothetical protein VMM93_04090 [Vicinamibacterales bacterium]|nr:hypothetical protein [Vicinamibacterales bacterium]
MTETQRLAAVLVLLASAACSNDSTIPSPVPPPSGSGDLTSLSGTVVGHFDAAPIGGATLVHGGVSTITNSLGQFTLNGVTASGAAGVTVNAPGHVFRRVVFNMSPNRSGVTIDLIRSAPPFEIEFYRMWVRDSLQSTSLQATRPWTVNPNFYFKTTLDDVEVTVPDDVIDRIVSVFANAIPELSGGRRQLGTVERGTTARDIVDGWVNVTFAQNLAGTLGRSTVGGNSGTMALLYAPLLISTPQNNPFGCDFYLYGIADHEVTHTMGFYHTFETIGDSFSGPGCTGTGRPERTRIHSAIMYARPSGNTDPDVDPPSALQSTVPGGLARREIACFRQ